MRLTESPKEDFSLDENGGAEPTAPDPYRPPQQFLEKSFEITYQSQISFMTEGLKLSALANGGAAVALLTYLGSITRDSSERPLEVGQGITAVPKPANGAHGPSGKVAIDRPSKPIMLNADSSTSAVAEIVSPADLVVPISFFAVGLSSCICSFAAGYFAQMAIMKYWAMTSEMTEPSSVSTRYRDGHLKAFSAALGLVIISAVGFVAGTLSASATFAQWREGVSLINRTGLAMVLLCLGGTAIAIAIVSAGRRKMSMISYRVARHRS